MKGGVNGRVALKFSSVPKFIDKNKKDSSE